MLLFCRIVKYESRHYYLWRSGITISVGFDCETLKRKILPNKKIK